MARWDSLRKLERNNLLLKYHEDNPDASMREIGEIFGISAQRVSKIINTVGDGRKPDTEKP